MAGKRLNSAAFELSWRTRVAAGVAITPKFVQIRPMPDPSGHLVYLEQQLAGLLVQFEVLSEAWPMAPRSIERA